MCGGLLSNMIISVGELEGDKNVNNVLNKAKCDPDGTEISETFSVRIVIAIFSKLLKVG